MVAAPLPPPPSSGRVGVMVAAERGEAALGWRKPVCALLSEASWAGSDSLDTHGNAPMI